MALTVHQAFTHAVAKVGWAGLNFDAIKYEMDHMTEFQPLGGIMKLTYTDKIKSTPWAMVFKVQRGEMINTNPDRDYIRVPNLMPAKFR